MYIHCAHTRTHTHTHTQRRFLVAFSDIQDITYEPELMSRGRVILDMRNQPVRAHIFCTINVSWCTLLLKRRASPLTNWLISEIHHNTNFDNIIGTLTLMVAQ